MTWIIPHIPKCGGTSLLRELERSNVRLFLDYDAPPPFRPAAVPNCARRNREFALLDFSPFEVVYGHFPINRHDRVGSRYAVLVRDPLDRAVSQFNYLIERRQRRARLTQHDEQLADRILTGEISFARWLNIQISGGFYRAYLDYWPASRFDLIGVMERYDTYCERLSDQLGIAIDARVRERSGHLDRPEISGQDQIVIDKVLRADREWYREFVRHAA